MERDITINISSDGHLTFVYDDALAELIQGGDAHVARVSHVEPAATGWAADMSPVAGPVLGPFPLRSEALAAERDWLTEHRGL